MEKIDFCVLIRQPKTLQNTTIIEIILLLNTTYNL